LFLQFKPILNYAWIDINSDKTLVEDIVYNEDHLKSCKQKCCHLILEKKKEFQADYQSYMPLLARKNIKNKYKDNLSIFLHRLSPLPRTLKFYL
jgi:hypothetical protein